jgi:hypothetical protein
MMNKRSVKINSKVPLDECIKIFLARGYYLHEKAADALILFKPGSAFTISIKRIPLELKIEIVNNDTMVSLKYGTLVLFDTGDLSKELSRLVRIIKSEVRATA